MVTKIKPKHAKLAVLIGQGLTQKQAYKEAFGDVQKDSTAEHNASELIQRPELRAIANEVQHDIQQLLKNEAYQSLLVIEQLRDDPQAPANVRYTCAKDLLDRAGHGATAKIEQTNNTQFSALTVTESEKEELRKLLA
jgi:hypothetical protein